MTYPKAYKGVKKLFVAGILSLAGSVCVWLAVIPGILGISAAFKGSLGGFFAGGIITFVFLLAGLLLPIIAYILKLVGLEQARHEEAQFHQGFLFAILALIFILVDTVFSAWGIGGAVIEEVVGTAYGIFDIIVTVFVIRSIRTLAGKLKDARMVQRSSSLVWYVTVFYATGLFAGLLSVLFESSVVMQILAGMLSLIAGILNLIVYIIFLVFLGRAKKMLKNSMETPPDDSLKSVIMANSGSEELNPV